MKITKIIYLLFGSTCLILGTIGAFLPILPTVPLYLLAAFCFAKSSERLHHWFTNTNLYKDNLEHYVQGNGMTRKTKIRIVGSASAVMAVGFLMMKNVPVGRGILVIVWICHILYFAFRVKTIPESSPFDAINANSNFETKEHLNHPPVSVPVKSEKNEIPCSNSTEREVGTL